MNATALPVARVRDRLLDAGVFGSMLTVWIVAYVALCPPQPARSAAHVVWAQR